MKQCIYFKWERKFCRNTLSHSLYQPCYVSGKEEKYLVLNRRDTNKRGSVTSFTTVQYNTLVLRVESYKEVTGLRNFARPSQCFVGGKKYDITLWATYILTEISPIVTFNASSVVLLMCSKFRILQIHKNYSWRFVVFWFIRNVYVGVYQFLREIYFVHL